METSVEPGTARYGARTRRPRALNARLTKKMQLKFPRRSSFVPLLTEWVRANAAAIDSGHRVAVSFGMRTGFFRQETVIAVGDDPEGFETDWKWTASTFPARIKSLAQALQAANIRGVFRVEHHDGAIAV